MFQAILTSHCHYDRLLSMERHTEAGALFTELVLEVFRVNGLALAAGDRLAAPDGLSSARWQVLGVVDHGPAPAATVARLMGLTRQSVQQTADALERDGFITYAENPHHKRAKLIVLTAKGREVLRQVEARQAAWANRIGAGIDERRLQAALDGLRLTRQHLDADSGAVTDEGLKRLEDM
jgi:DNA-binding MarR family transcriptional regulator